MLAILMMGATHARGITDRLPVCIFLRPIQGLGQHLHMTVFEERYNTVEAFHPSTAPLTTHHSPPRSPLYPTHHFHHHTNRNTPPPSPLSLLPSPRERYTSYSTASHRKQPLCPIGATNGFITKRAVLDLVSGRLVVGCPVQK